MAFDNRDSIDFGKTDIRRLFKSIFFPTLFGMVFNVLFILTDGIFVGHGVGPEGIACVNLASPLMMFITGIGMMFGIGCSVVAAIHLAQENVKAARINVTQAFGMAALFAVVIGTVFYCFPSFIFRLIGVSEQLAPMERGYYLWFIPTCLFLMFQLIGLYIIRLDGSPRYAMYANVIPSIINIILDYVFIFPCGWGLMGAALATDIGAGVGMILVVYYMIFRSKKLKFYRLKATMTSLKLTLRNVWYQVKLGFSAFLGEFAISTMAVTGNIIFGIYLGDEGVAAYSVICYLFPVVYMIYSAVIQSAQPIFSYNYGANLNDRVRRTFYYSTTISLVFGFIMSLCFFFFAPTIVAIFIEPGTKTFELAAQGLPLYAIGFVFLSFNVSVIGYFQSIEKALISTCLMLLRGIIFLVPFFIFTPRVMGIEGLWLAVPFAEASTFLIEIYFLKRNSI